MKKSKKEVLEQIQKWIDFEREQWCSFMDNSDWNEETKSKMDVWYSGKITGMEHTLNLIEHHIK